MEQFHPPMSSRETDVLIEIANSSTEFWVQAAIDQARAELTKGGIPEEYERQCLQEWKEQWQQEQIEWQKQLEANETADYTVLQRINILLSAPFIIAGRRNVHLSVLELKEENYKKMVPQRIALLLAGSVLWVVIFFAINEFIEFQTRKKIEKVDITEWEKRYYGSDSLIDESRSKEAEVKNDSSKKMVPADR